jgi:GTP cyclohydrolase I
VAYSEEDRYRIRRAVETIVDIVSRDLDPKETESLDLSNTPNRVTKMLLDEVCARPDVPSLKPDKVQAGSLDCVAVGPISIASTCAHHLLPFSGHAWVAYLGRELRPGLSKFSRVILALSQRLQLQEVLTREVLDHIVRELKPDAALVAMRTRHGCVGCRGVRQPDQMMVTSALYPTEGVGLKDWIVPELYRNLAALGY